jgi:recombinational DNA repair protein (RecF pathway)
MYHKYVTEAFVLTWRDTGEGDRMYALMTKDFGLVWVRVLAARAEKSKMRYALQTGGHARVALIRGKRGWRAGGAVEEADLLEGGAAQVFARAGALALRLIHGEEKNEPLFETLRAAREELRGSSREILPDIEILLVARMLYALGYLPSEVAGVPALYKGEFGPALKEVTALRTELVRSINTALAATQL